MFRRSPSSYTTKSYDEALNWIYDHKNKIEKSRYGRNRRSLEDGMREQNEFSREVEEFQLDLDKSLNRIYDKEKKENLQSAYDSLKEVSEKKKKCLNTMLDITSLEEHCGRLSREMDVTSVGLVGPLGNDSPTGSDGNLQGFVSPSSQDCVFAVQDNWDWVVKLVKCIDIHLKNGSNYHQFFHEIDESAPWMLQDLERIQKSFETLPLSGDYGDAQRLMTELQDVLVCLKQWEAKTDRLWTKASAVVPVQLRTDGVTDPTAARALCDYETMEIRIREGEDILLLENSQPDTWRIRNGRGEEGEVPALAVLIPGPYKAAMDAAVKLRLQLLASWTNAIKRLGKRILCFMLLVFKPDYKDDEIDAIRSIPRLDKQDLMRILDYVEDTLKSHWADHEGFINLQERILALRMILEEIGDDGIKDEKEYQSLIVQITSLEKLMHKYKDIWDNWELYKTSLEASQNPQLMLIVDKWEQLQFVTKDFFSKFWKNELPLDTMERSLMTLKTMTLHGEKLDVHHGIQPEEETVKMDDGWEETRVTETKYETERELNRAKKIDLESALGTTDTLTQDGGFSDTRVVDRRIVTTVETETPIQRAKKIEIDRPIHRVEKVETERPIHRVETIEIERPIQRTEISETEKPVHRSRVIDINQALGGDQVRQDQGWEETRVVETQMQSERPLARSTMDQVDMRKALGSGSSESGFDETLVKTSRVYTSQVSNGSMQEGQEVFEEGMVEEGAYETNTGYQRTRVSGSSIDGTDFGYATETRTAETEQVQRAEVEEQKTFVIRSVINPVDSTEISLQQAILEGVIRPDEGSYENLKTGESIPLPTAMTNGLIKVQFTSTRRGQEKRTTLGIITVKTTREPVRPYLIKNVTDTRTNEKVSQSEAANRNIINEQRGIYINLKTGERMLITEAIEKSLVQVEYVGEVPPSEVVSKTYAVRAVLDKRWKKVITFAEAVRRGIIDKDAGAYRDTETGESMYVGDAIIKGFLKARKIDRSASLDIDPENKMLVDKTDAIRKKVLQPLKVITAFKRAARMGLKSKDTNNN